MHKTIILRYALHWLALLVLAILNAAIRELLLVKILSEFRAQQVSVFTGLSWFFLFTWLINKQYPIESRTDAVIIGLIWVFLTAAFEVFMIVCLEHKPIQTALAQYDLLSGNLWTLLLVGLFFIPLFVWKIGTKQGEKHVDLSS